MQVRKSPYCSPIVVHMKHLYYWMFCRPWRYHFVSDMNKAMNKKAITISWQHFINYDTLLAVTVCTADWFISGRRWWCIGIEWIAFIALPHWWHDIRFRFSDHSSVGILEKEKGLTPVTSVHLCCCTQWPLFWPFKCWDTGKRKRADIIGNSPSSLLYTVTTKEKSQQRKLLALFGAPSGTRTQDPLIKSQLLYQLS